MDGDARITLYGGAAISVMLLAIGAGSNPTIGATGIGFAGATLALAALVDRIPTT